jgi:hypothetical protein
VSESIFKLVFAQTDMLLIVPYLKRDRKIRYFDRNIKGECFVSCRRFQAGSAQSL